MQEGQRKTKDGVSMIDRTPYEIARAERFLTPALLIYPEFVAENVRTTLGLLGGDASRFRPHIKTAKLASVVREMVALGVMQFKCATTLELLTACTAGAREVLVAYPVIGPAARRVRDIARSFPSTAVSVLVESPAMLAEWAGSDIGLFIDVNPGMDRTGIPQDTAAEIVALARTILRARIPLRGIHYYDGHLPTLPLDERAAVAHRGYDRLMALIAEMEQAGIPVECVITAGTPTFPCSLSYVPFAAAKFHHQVSPGTVVYNDLTSLHQLPPEWGYRPAALVLSRVVSHPRPNVVTCDAGHKTLSVDCGVPNCSVLAREELLPRKPSEEHLPIEIPADTKPPAIGDLLYLFPKHVCPTINNFDHALIVERGKVTRVDRVTARGRENPLLSAASAAPAV
jgi:D-serine deaminase-like pyridoxal phosphate-dependent protein